MLLSVANFVDASSDITLFTVFKRTLPRGDRNSAELGKGTSAGANETRGLTDETDKRPR